MCKIIREVGPNDNLVNIRAIRIERRRKRIRKLLVGSKANRDRFRYNRAAVDLIRNFNACLGTGSEVIHLDSNLIFRIAAQSSRSMAGKLLRQGHWQRRGNKNIVNSHTFIDQ